MRQRRLHGQLSPAARRRGARCEPPAIGSRPSCRWRRQVRAAAARWRTDVRSPELASGSPGTSCVKRHSIIAVGNCSRSARSATPEIGGHDSRTPSGEPRPSGSGCGTWCRPVHSLTVAARRAPVSDSRTPYLAGSRSADQAGSAAKARACSDPPPRSAHAPLGPPADFVRSCRSFARPRVSPQQSFNAKSVAMGDATSLLESISSLPQSRY